jgi:hypothetical protein
VGAGREAALRSGAQAPVACREAWQSRGGLTVAV